MESMDVFKNSKMRLMNEQPSKIFSWITILFILMFLFIIIGFSYHFNVYKKALGYVEIGDKYNLRVIVSDDLIPLRKDYELFIENKKIDYEVIDIQNINQYYQVFLKSDIDENLLIDNNIITINFRKYQITLIDAIIRKIKKGMV